MFDETGFDTTTHEDDRLAALFPEKLIIHRIHIVCDNPWDALAAVHAQLHRSRADLISVHTGYFPDGVAECTVTLRRELPSVINRAVVVLNNHAGIKRAKVEMTILTGQREANRSL